MKLSKKLLHAASLGLLSLALSLYAPLLAQTSEEKVIPTEVSQPPYAVGDLVVKQGHYIERGGEQAAINLRLENNQVRVYWIDADGLIADAEAQTGSIHIKGTGVKGNPYQQLQPLAGNSGLAGQRAIFPPHNFFTRLVLVDSASGASKTHTFRYTPAMNTATMPAIASE